MKDYQMDNPGKVAQKPIVEDAGSYYRLEGDDFWYVRCIGPGPDMPLINIGPGPNPDPRPYKKS